MKSKYYQKRSWHLAMMIIAVVAVGLMLYSTFAAWNQMELFRRIVRLVAIIGFSSIFYTHYTRYRHWRSPDEEDPI
ncbi:MAG: hypothetical protein EOO16_05295 [Chitinophagaceae bacterium]|nr:MAG: hypothetical protein EOO16_05295 [Chitinophagaceae bacterium]